MALVCASCDHPKALKGYHIDLMPTYIFYLLSDAAFTGVVQDIKMSGFPYSFLITEIQLIKSQIRNGGPCSHSKLWDVSSWADF